MNIQIIELAPIPIAMIRYTGPFEQMEAKFEDLYQWVSDFTVPAQRSIALYWDNPEFTPIEQCRSAVAAELPIGWIPVGTTGRKIEISKVEGGKYAVMRHIGPYDQLATVWSKFTSEIEGRLQREILELPAIEIYENDPSDTPAHQLITDLYMPVR